jgi:hypothetical protein
MQKIVFDRNQRIAHELIDLNRTKSAYLVIGFSHLVGEKGVLSILADNNYSVEPVSERQLEVLSKDLEQRALGRIKDFYLSKFNQFLSEATEYQGILQSSDFPPVKFVEQRFLQELACEGTPCPILGLYDSTTLRLARSMVPAILRDEYQRVGIVFHEYVHFVQEEFGGAGSIDQQSPFEWSLREKEANLLQLSFVHWLKTGQSY